MIYTRNNKVLFLIYITIFIGLNFLHKELLNVDDLIINYLSETLTQEQILESLNLKQKWQWISYIIIPLLLLLKISIIAAILDAGCFFFDKKTKYKNLFNIAIKAEFIFLIVLLFKINWFYVFQQDFTFEDLQNFYPLSALNVTGYENIQLWFIYPLQVLNLFELAYWFILAYLLGKELNINTNKGMVIVASSYGVGLLIWVVTIMFFILNMS